MPTDLEATRHSLIQRLTDRADVEAWDEFASLYGPIVYRVALAKGFQAADADDIVQDVLVAVAGSVGKWLQRSERGGFRAWLMTITRNEAVNQFMRRATRPLGIDGSRGQLMLRDVMDPLELSSQILLEHERSIFQWAATQVQQSVAEHTWRAFWLTAVMAQPIEEVAVTLNMRPANVYIARSRIMARIKELVHLYPSSAVGE